MKDKYFGGKLQINWIRNPQKSVRNYFIIWKTFTNSFPNIIEWIAWKFGNGKNVTFGLDPWVGTRENYKLSQNAIASLHEV